MMDTPTSDSIDNHAHTLDPEQKPLVDDQGRCLVCAIEGFTTAYDKQSALLGRLLIAADPGGAEVTDTPESRVERAIRLIEQDRARVRRAHDRLIGIHQDGGPYRLGRWTEQVNHVDSCDCDPDREEVGDKCMTNSPWTYAVLVEMPGGWDRVFLSLPRSPGETDHENLHQDYRHQVENQ